VDAALVDNQQRARLGAPRVAVLHQGELPVVAAEPVLMVAVLHGYFALADLHVPRPHTPQYAAEAIDAPADTDVRAPQRCARAGTIGEVARMVVAAGPALVDDHAGAFACG